MKPRVETCCCGKQADIGLIGMDYDSTLKPIWACFDCVPLILCTARQISEKGSVPLVPPARGSN